MFFDELIDKGRENPYFCKANPEERAGENYRNKRFLARTTGI